MKEITVKSRLGRYEGKNNVYMLDIYIEPFRVLVLTAPEAIQLIRKIEEKL